MEKPSSSREGRDKNGVSGLTIAYQLKEKAMNKYSIDEILEMAVQTEKLG